MAHDELMRNIDINEATLSSEVREPEELTESTNLLDRVTKALRSKKNHLVYWALTQYPKACEQDRKMLYLFSQVCSFFFSTSRVIEYLAINTVNKIVDKFAKNVAGQLLNVMLDRITNQPAIEYSHCLARIVPYFTEVTISSCIDPLMDKFLTKSDPFQYALGEFLVNVRLDQMNLSADFFGKLINSNVIVNEYLSKIMRSEGRNKANGDWWTRVFLNQLIQAAAANTAIRAGVIDCVISLSDVTAPRFFWSYVTTGLEWAQQDPAIALMFVAKADEIVTPRTIELQPKVRALMDKLSAMDESNVRVKLPKIIASNMWIFASSDSRMASTIIGFAKDRNPQVRLAFLNNLFAFLAHYGSGDTHETLISVLMQLFSDPDDEVRSSLCSSMVYSALSHTRLLSLIPHFTALMDSSKRWRDVASCLRTYMTFPTDVIRQSWSSFVAAAFSSVRRNPHALSTGCYALCSCLMSILDASSSVELADMLIQEFAKSDSFRMREMFGPLVASVCMHSHSVEVVARLWGPIPSLARDSVHSVSASVIANLMKISQYYSSRNDSSSEKEVLSLFMSFSESTNLLIREKWAQSWKEFNEQRKEIGLSRSFCAPATDGIPKRVGVVPSASASKAVSGGLLAHALPFHRARASRLVGHGSKAKSRALSTWGKLHLSSSYDLLHNNNRNS